MQSKIVNLFLVLSCSILIMVSCSPTSPTTSTSSSTSPKTATNSSTLLQATKTDQPVVPADIIFYNGNIITIEKSQPLVQAIAVRGKLIQAIGVDQDILTLRGSDTIMIDLQGKTLMPGFIDTHRHTKDRYLPDFIDDQQVLMQNGITTASYLYVDDGILATVKAMYDAGQLRARTSLYLVYSKACGEIVGNWYRMYAPTHEPGEMLRLAGVKVYADGGSCGRPATSFNRLNDGLGNLWFTQDEMNAIVKDIDTAGYQVAIHAIGDRAVDQALNAIEFALRGRPNTLRHRIEHNTTVNPASYTRYQKLGVVATVFGNIWSCNDVFFSTGIVPDPPEYQAWNFAYQSMLDADPEMHLAWHTDYPWASSNPLFHLYSLATPYEIAGDLSECGDPSWIGDKTVSLDEALSMMTIEGAFALFREKEVGSLLPGKYADLIILSGNPKTDLNAIKDLQVWMTMVGGHVEWCAPGHEAFCPGTNVIKGSALSSPIKIRFQITTTSDWATLTLKSGGSLINPVIVSSSTEATNLSTSDNRFSINQTIQRANTGASVHLILDAYLSDATTGGQLEFVIESGAIGDTTIKLFNYLQNNPKEVSTVILSETSKTFTISVDKFISP